MNRSKFSEQKHIRGAYRKRRIASPPRFDSYKPSGIPRSNLDKITITIDEFEAFRLADYKGHDHLEASVQMQISRPTFSRLIEKARAKIAHAVVDGLELLIEGGNIDFSQGMHRCRDCGEEHTHALNKPIEDCPECGSGNVEDLTSKYMRSDSRDKGTSN